MGLGENFLKRQECNHENEICICNFYGDMIDDYACGSRSEWLCEDCGRFSFRPEIDEDCSIINYKF